MVLIDSVVLFPDVPYESEPESVVVPAVGETFSIEVVDELLKMMLFGTVPDAPRSISKVEVEARASIEIASDAETLIGIGRIRED